MEVEIKFFTGVRRATNGSRFRHCSRVFVPLVHLWGQGFVYFALAAHFCHGSGKSGRVCSARC